MHADQTLNHDRRGTGTTKPARGRSEIQLCQAPRAVVLVGIYYTRLLVELAPTGREDVDMQYQKKYFYAP
jgi:hypothetical protein